jgi:hypothetical protein
LVSLSKGNDAQHGQEWEIGEVDSPTFIPVSGSKKLNLRQIQLEVPGFSQRKVLGGWNSDHHGFTAVADIEEGLMAELLSDIDREW